MCAYVNYTTMNMLAEIRRAELLDQAAHYQLVKQATGGKAAAARNGLNLNVELRALRLRLGAKLRQQTMTKPIDLGAAETA